VTSDSESGERPAEQSGAVGPRWEQGREVVASGWVKWEKGRRRKREARGAGAGGIEGRVGIVVKGRGGRQTDRQG
jgi:hypothetical protein